MIYCDRVVIVMTVWQNIICSVMVYSFCSGHVPTLWMYYICHKQLWHTVNRNYWNWQTACCWNMIITKLLLFEWLCSTLPSFVLHRSIGTIFWHRCFARYWGYCFVVPCMAFHKKTDNIVFIGCIACMHAVHRCGLLLQMQHDCMSINLCVSVCLYVGHSHELC